MPFGWTRGEALIASTSGFTVPRQLDANLMGRGTER